MSFEKLLGELEELQSMHKSEPANEDKGGGDEDDKKIAEAAELNDQENHDEPADDKNENEDKDKDDEPMGKSFNFKLDSGEEIEAVDGTEFIKSLMSKIDGQEVSVKKFMGTALDLIKSQGEQISALKTEITKLGSEGRGRKTVVSIAEKPAAGTMAKSEPEGLSAEEFMAKALTAQAAGRLTALDVSIAEASFLKGLPVRADIVNKVLV